MDFLSIFRPFVNIGTLTVQVEHTCPHSLATERFDQTVVLSEKACINTRRIDGVGRNCMIVSHRPELTHWFAGGDPPADMRPIQASEAF